MSKPEIWSYGGGVQSVAILVLILQGKLPKPELIVMADTGRERQAVWDYLEEIARPAMNANGMDLEVVPHSYSNVDIMGHNGDLLIPVFFRKDDGKEGKLPTFCSREWKQWPVTRYIKEKGYGTRKPIKLWFGMSLDEVGRMRKSRRKWIEHYYPLCQDATVRLRRHECRLLIERYGWPQPPASACWMCPQRPNRTWREMKDNEVSDFEKATRFERVISGAGWGEIYLHKSLAPIDEVDFEEKEEQATLFDECAYSCWT